MNLKEYSEFHEYERDWNGRGAMKQTTRWMLTVSSDTDRVVRRYLAAAGRKGDLSRFVEEAAAVINSTERVEFADQVIPTAFLLDPFVRVGRIA